jgi:hypothetical protein
VLHLDSRCSTSSVAACPSCNQRGQLCKRLPAYSVCGTKFNPLFLSPLLFNLLAAMAMRTNVKDSPLRTRPLNLRACTWVYTAVLRSGTAADEKRCTGVYTEMMQSASADLGETNIMGKRDVHVCTPSYGLKQKKNTDGTGLRRQRWSDFCSRFSRSRAAAQQATINLDSR